MYADAWSILDDYPRATYAVLDQQDHALPVRRLTAYLALVDDWLDRMEEHLDAWRAVSICRLREADVGISSSSRNTLPTRAGRFLEARSDFGTR